MKFDKAVEIANKSVVRNADGTIGTYIVINDNIIGWIKEFKYLIRKEIAEMTLELADSITVADKVFLVHNSEFLINNGKYLTE
jgi:hypothetical protein